MTSEKKITSNRLNAQKSTGPKTDEGKSRIRTNALKHGLFSTIHIMPNESEDDFKALEEALRFEFAPSTPLQELHFSKIVELFWRLKRIEPIEHSIFCRTKVDSKYEHAISTMRALASEEEQLPFPWEQSPFGFRETTQYQEALETVTKMNRENSFMITDTTVSMEGDQGIALERISKYERHLASYLQKSIDDYYKGRKVND